MSDRNHDVVVIGAGVGGLCAAALLSHRGYKVLVVERTVRLGGRCSTEEIDGFKLSTGAVALHRGGVFEDIYKEVGAELDLVDMPHQFYRTGSIQGENYKMPAKGAIPALLDIANSLEKNRAKLLGHMAKEIAVGRVISFLGKEDRGEEKSNDITFRDWLLKYTENEIAHKTFDAMACNVTGYHTYEVKASEMFALLDGMRRFAALGISPQGNEENMKSLARIIKKNGGDVRLGCPVKRIIVKDNVAMGVMVEESGAEIEIPGRVVISNIGPKNTVKLVGEEYFDGDYLALAERLVTVGMILVHVASDKPLCLENGELGGTLLIGLRRLTSAFPLTNFSRNLAPPGKHLLYCVGSPPSYLEPVNIDEELQQTEMDLRDQFPEFNKTGRIIKFEVVLQDLPKPGRLRIPRETPIENLFNVGDGVQELGSGGTSAAAESAKEVAGWVEKNIRI